MADGKPTKTRTGSRFADPNADTPTVEATAESTIAPPELKASAAFNQAAGSWDKDNNIFFILHSFTPAEYKRLQDNAPQAIAEYRQMMGRGTSHAPLSQDEITELKDIASQAQKDVVAHKGLTLQVAESLCLAAKAAGVDHDAYLKNLFDTDGNPGGIDVNHTTKAGPYKFDVQTWLHMVKEHGEAHGLGYFADKIQETPGPNGSQVLKVDDPTVLRQIVDLRNNPRMSAVMGAELLKDGGHPQLAYDGVNFTPDPVVLKEQQQFMKLGFDVGLRGADGVNGPLTIAAQKEFMDMYKLTDRSQIPAKLDDVTQAAEALRVKAQAQVDAYNGAHPRMKTDAATGLQTADTTPPNKVTTAQAFGMLVASEQTGVKTEHLLGVAIAEKAFDPGKPAPGRSPGLYHLTDSQWLMTVAEHGREHGLGDIVDRLEPGIKRGKDGKVTNVTIQDPLLRQYVLNLRKDPAVAATMEAEHSKEYPVYLDIANCYLNDSRTQNAGEVNHLLQAEGKFSHFNIQDTPWCAAFANSVMQSAGVTGNGSTSARSFLNNYGTRVKGDEIRPGDLAVIPRGTDKSQGHVAMIMDRHFDPKKNEWMLDVIGGNQGTPPTVCVHTWPEKILLGAVRPPAADIMVASNTPAVPGPGPARPTATGTPS